MISCRCGGDAMQTHICPALVRLCWCGQSIDHTHCHPPLLPTTVVITPTPVFVLPEGWYVPAGGRFPGP